MLIDEPIFQLLKQSIKRDGWLEIPAEGNSMFPFIQSGDVCRFVSCSPFLLKRGDVLLVQTNTGQLVAHRFIKKQTGNYQQLFILKGDTNLGFDHPIQEDQILGKLISIQKQNIRLSQDHFVTKIWGALILTFPVLSGFLRKYLNRKYKLLF